MRYAGFFRVAMTLALGVPSACSTKAIGNINCGGSVLTFQPAISSDGTYRINVQDDGQSTSCTPKIAGGQVSGASADVSCTGPINLTFGGQTRTEMRFDGGSTLMVNGLTTIEGLRWQTKTSQAIVTVEKDGAVLSTKTVSFMGTTLSDCSDVTMIGVMKLD
jgi:hypothetical protein